jgi:hypothetical protein
MKKKKRKYFEDGSYYDEEYADYLLEEKLSLQSKIYKRNFNIPFNQFYKPKYNNITSNSWFDIKEANINHNISITRIRDINDSNSTLIKCMKITVLPNNSQKKTLLSWFEAYRKMYNETLRIIKDLTIKKIKKRYNFRFIRTNYCTTIKDEYIKRFNINAHILDGAIKLACTSYKSAFTNFKRGNIRHFTIRPIKQNKKSKI